jgi:hypothetical protein
VIYPLITGPKATAKLATTIYVKTSQIRSRALNMSSILPVTITVGTAEAKPVKTRPAAIAPIEGTAAIIMLKPLNNAALMIYSLFRPKASEYGGKTTFPIACARQYLNTVSL